MTNPVPVDILAALDQLGIEYTVTGEEAKGLCPNPQHDDHAPSWSINLDSGQHHCFSCGWGGSFVLLTMVAQDSSPQDAKTWIGQRKIQDIAEGKTKQHQRQVHEEITPADLWEFDREYPKDELNYRGIGEFNAQDFELLWDHQRNGWIIPFKDIDQRFIGYQFKPHHDSDGTPLNYPKHLNKSGSIFGIPDAWDNDVLIMESPLDVVYVASLGNYNSLALYGSSMSSIQADIIRDRFESVTLMYDDDSAGRQAVSRTLGLLKGIECFVFAYGETQKMGPYMVHPEASGRDPGDLSMTEIEDGIAWATSGFRTGFM